MGEVEEAARKSSRPAGVAKHRVVKMPWITECRVVKHRDRHRPTDTNEWLVEKLLVNYFLGLSHWPKDMERCCVVQAIVAAARLRVSAGWKMVHDSHRTMLRADVVWEWVVRHTDDDSFGAVFRVYLFGTIAHEARFSFQVVQENPYGQAHLSDPGPLTHSG